MTDAELRRLWAAWYCRRGGGAWAPVMFLGHRLSVPEPLVDGVRALAAALYDYDAEGSDTGNYNCRPIDNDPTKDPSIHSYGAAIDLDWLSNPDGPRGSDPFGGELTPAQIGRVEAIRNTAGVQFWQWGGRWRRVDRMHFQPRIGPDAATIDWSTVRSSDEMTLSAREQKVLADFVRELDEVKSNPSFVDEGGLIRDIRKNIITADELAAALAKYVTAGDLEAALADGAAGHLEPGEYVIRVVRRIG